jgi:hypothetical protein
MENSGILIQNLADELELACANGENESVAFSNFLNGIIALVESKQITQQEAAQAITGAVFIPGIDDDPLREEITIVAGDLEGGRVQGKHSWSYLLKLADELRHASLDP